MSKIRIRPARATDRPGIEAICAQIWDGDDYIPAIWDTWMADPHGQLAVAEAQGNVVGLAKLTRLADREWWMEGLRVDPGFRRRGTGGQLLSHLTHHARATARGTLRFATNALNEAVHRIAAREGFAHVATYRRYTAGCSGERAPEKDTRPLHRLDEADVAAAWRLIQHTSRRLAAHGLYTADWKWKVLTRERLTHHLRAGDAWGRREGSTLTGLALACRAGDADPVHGAPFHVGYVDGADDALLPILRGLCPVAAQAGCTSVRLRPIEDPGLIAAAEQADYTHIQDHDIWIFELDLDRNDFHS